MATSQKKVSILMLTYNLENYVERAIESCLEQTYQNFEICIVDDNSTDKTFDIVKKYHKKYPEKIKIYQFPMNVGKYSIQINYNKGLDMCEGEYIAILDGDEYMKPDRLKKQVEFLEKNKDFYAVSNEKEVVDKNFKPINAPVNCFKNQKYLTPKNLILYGNTFSNCWMKRNDDLRLDTSLKTMGDWHFIIKMAIRGKLGFLDEKLTTKVIHDINVSHTRVKSIEEDYLLTLASLEYEFPQFVKYTKIRRANFFVDKVLKGRDFRYLNGIASVGLITLTKVFYYKIKGKIIKG